MVQRRVELASVYHRVRDLGLSYWWHFSKRDLVYARVFRAASDMFPFVRISGVTGHLAYLSLRRARTVPFCAK